ncbi:MAG: hypothetical protein LH702_06510 [Phormidesmis sp. CAN_BIN44]|nr:hypothetical protein [Phormidesmis sp. CAN_BIN44]
MPLLIERSHSLQIISGDAEWQIYDRLIYLLHDPKPKLLKLLSGSSQLRLTLEKLPEVEEIPTLELGLSETIEPVLTLITDSADS